jgi:hypothetical protein
LIHMSAKRVVRIAARHSHYLFGGEKEWGENRKRSAKLTVSMAEGLPIETYVCRTSSKNSGPPFSLLVWWGERMGREQEVSAKLTVSMAEGLLILEASIDHDR